MTYPVEFDKRLRGKKFSNLSALIPKMPSFDAGALTVTQNLMLTLPGHFDAVFPFAINIGAATTLDNACVAVSERSDTSKTVPVIGGVSYNVAAAAGTQLGFIPLTWNGGSASVALPLATAARPYLKLGDEIPLASIPRVEAGKSFPLAIVRYYWNNRTYAAHQFSSAAEADTFSTLLSPYEFYSVAQSGVDGVSTPANFTNTWTAGANTSSIRIFGLAVRLRGSGDLILMTGDSIVACLGAGGDVVTNNALNAAGGWSTQTALALANVNKPVGFINAGIGNQTSAVYTQRLYDFAALINPTIITHCPYTPNDVTTTVASMSTEFARTLDVQSYSWSIGAVYVPVTPVPYTGSGSEALRIAMVNKIKALPNSFVIDANESLYDANNSGGGYWASASYTVDGTHPSLAGYNRVAALSAVPILQQVIG